MGFVKIVSANFRSKSISCHIRTLKMSFDSRCSFGSFTQSQGTSFLAANINNINLCQPKRHLLPRFPDLLGIKTGGKKLKYSENHLLGYSKEQMFNIASKVEHYPKFVPWCREAIVIKQGSAENSFYCRLTVGFPPVVERYTSLVTISRPRIVKSVCSDALLFHHLKTIWKFSEGIDNRPDTCTLDFYVDFEFRSKLHTKLAHMFFDEVVGTMVNAFLKQALLLYGPQSITTNQQRKSVKHHPSDS